MAVDRSRLPAIGADPAFSFPAIVRHRLANGLAVRTVEHASVPVVSFILQTRGGSAADAPGLEGVTALTADMLDEGTGALTAIDVSEALARLGAEFDIEVGPDTTSVTLTTLARFADRGATLLAELVTRPSLREDDFSRVRRLRLDRLRQLRDLPAALAERAFLRLLYGAHPYGHLSIGSASTLEALTLEDVQRAHAALFRPERSTLIVAGALSHQALLHAAEQAFGGWRPGAFVPGASDRMDDRVVPAVPVTRLAVIPRERAAQSHLRIGHLSASRATPDYPALVVMNAVLGGQFVSRVNLKLREEKGYTYGARTGFDWRLGPGPFSLETSVETPVTVDAVADALAELSAIRGARPATPHELTLAKATLTRGYPRNFETAQQVGRSVAQLALYDLPDDYFATFTPRVSAVSPDEVTQVAERHLHPDQLTTLIVGDHQALEPSLADLGLGAPVVLPTGA